MKKGITPIISIIILLLITIALAGVAWTFLQGYLFTTIQGQINIPPGTAFCTNGLITVQLTNQGQTTLHVSNDPTRSDIIGAFVDSTDVRAYLNSTTIQPGNAAIILQDYNCGSPSGCSAGQHKIRITTASSAAEAIVYC